MLKMFLEIKELYEIIKELNMKKKVILIAILAIFFIFGASCATSSNAFIYANRECANIMLPDLIKYIEKDNTLQQSSKDLKIKSVKTWLKLTREVK